MDDLSIRFRPMRFWHWLPPVLLLFLCACSSVPRYDSPPEPPVNIKPGVNAVLAADAATTFVWKASSQTQWYEFHVFNQSTGDIEQYYERRLDPLSICRDGLCSVQRTIALPSSTMHAWRVRAGNSAGWSNWSRSIFQQAR